MIISRNWDEDFPYYVEIIKNVSLNLHQIENQYEIVFVEQNNSTFFHQTKLCDIGLIFAQALMEVKCSKKQTDQNLRMVFLETNQFENVGKIIPEPQRINEVLNTNEITNLEFNLHRIIEYDDFFQLIVD